MGSGGGASFVGIEMLFSFAGGGAFVGKEMRSNRDGWWWSVCGQKAALAWVVTYLSARERSMTRGKQKTLFGF